MLRQSIGGRLLAIALAGAMIFNSSSFTALAKGTQSTGVETQAEEELAQEDSSEQENSSEQEEEVSEDQIESQEEPKSYDIPPELRMQRESSFQDTAAMMHTGY